VGSEAGRISIFRRATAAIAWDARRLLRCLGSATGGMVMSPTLLTRFGQANAQHRPWANGLGQSSLMTMFLPLKTNPANVQVMSPVSRSAVVVTLAPTKPRVLLKRTAPWTLTTFPSRLPRCA
jgi:hypothetical protein